ncbi:ester cyclase [Leptolyngbya sp. NIES-2104]|uniref:ester cyclase n=1 Tax=Leptolyngbya sp. NIES-2104 TaxID=1552121 RepID=UPI000AC868C8|nr:ester cyclase [Leptolyngbya sp. NIES-2104]
MNRLSFSTKAFVCATLVLLTLTLTAYQPAVGISTSPDKISASIATTGSPGFVSDDPRARGLIEIGEVGIARENNEALRNYFAPDFVLHGPGGDRTYEEVRDGFASMRAAFPDLSIVREYVIVDSNYVGARTRFSGTFKNDWRRSPNELVPPTGKPISWALNNIFRYNDSGRLAEEWVEYDIPALRRQLGVESE